MGWDHGTSDVGWHAGSAQDMLRPYVAFNAALRSAYHALVLRLEEQCRMLLGHQLQVAFPKSAHFM